MKAGETEAEEFEKLWYLCPSRAETERRREAIDARVRSVPHGVLVFGSGSTLDGHRCHNFSNSSASVCPAFSAHVFIIHHWRHKS